MVPFVLVLIPPAAALLVTAAHGGGSDVRRLFGRLGRWRVGWYWYAAAVGIPLVEKVVVDLSGIALGETTPARLVDALTGAALVVPFVVVVPAILEEFGWRGFGAQTAADDGHSPAWAALVVGVIFVLLHVPLYLPGQLYDGLPFWPLPLVLLAGSVLLTWIYLRTGSALSRRTDARVPERHRAAHLGTGPDLGVAGPRSRAHGYSHRRRVRRGLEMVALALSGPERFGFRR